VKCGFLEYGIMKTLGAVVLLKVKQILTFENVEYPRDIVDSSFVRIMQKIFEVDLCIDVREIFLRFDIPIEFEQINVAPFFELPSWIGVNVIRHAFEVIAVCKELGIMISRFELQCASELPINYPRDCSFAVYEKVGHAEVGMREEKHFFIGNIGREQLAETCVDGPLLAHPVWILVFLSEYFSFVEKNWEIFDGGR
jgi:hypothetical protein